MIDAETAAVNRRLGAFTGGAGLLIMLGLLRHTSGGDVGEGLLTGFEAAAGISALLISVLLFWSARNTLRNLDAPPSYWRAQEARVRRILGRTLTALSVLCLIAGVIAASQASWILTGALLGFSAISGGLVLAAVMGAIRPTDDFGAED